MNKLVSISIALILTACSLSRADRREEPPASTQAAAPSPSPAAPALSVPADAANFESDLRLLFRMVACAGQEPLPADVNPKVVDEYCAWLGPKIDEYRSHYVQPAAAFINGIRPAGLPTTVVYPFGGGDLLSALVTYPDGLEFTTLSLEHAGDPRTAQHLDAATLAKDLTWLRRCVSGLFVYADSTSENLMQLEKGGIPGQLSMFLVALAVYDYEPVSLRYFRVEPDGGIHYLTQPEIAKMEGTQAPSLNKVWVRPRSSAAFSNMELTFRKKGDEKSPLRVHRHIAANLADDRLDKDPSVLRHLEAKGTVSTMTKAASYLLWSQPFLKIRSYLLEHSAYMVADSTGIPPSVAQKAGFTLETYGKFEGSFLPMGKQYNDEFRALWKSQPQRELPFRYGYPDNNHNNHLMVMKPAARK